eukprot:5360077-Ditylum_brightwellii.AAC.1
MKGIELDKTTSDNVHPGDCASMDQYIVKHKCCTIKTAYDTTTMNTGGTMLTDHASTMIFLFNQISFCSGEMLTVKYLVDCAAVE